MTRAAALLGCSLALLLALPAAGALASDGRVQAGAAVIDGTYNVGSSAGQYATTRDAGYGDYDPQLQQVKNQASYGVQSRMSVRALVVRGAEGTYLATVTNDTYIPQDALARRTGQLAAQMTDGALDESNIMMAVNHSHSSPFYSSLTAGVWTFQDVFDYRLYDYYARRNAMAIARAYRDLRPVRVSATASYFDKIQKNPMGPGRADDGSPSGFPRTFTDHDLSVVRFEDISSRKRPKPLATLVNYGEHGEFLDGVDVISAEFSAAMNRFVDRTVGGVTLFTQNATGNSEINEEYSGTVQDRLAFNHTQYNQMEWGARLLADAVIGNVRDISRQRPNADDRPTPYGGTSYRDRFVPWMSRFAVGVENVWFPGPVTRVTPSVNNCKTDPALAGNPRVGTAADCSDVPVADSAQPVTEQLPLQAPGLSSDDFEALGVPFPENTPTPSTGSLEDTTGVRLQAFRLGDILLTVCPCEQWADQSYNIKTRLDTIPGNEWLGYDPTSPDADPSNRCVQDGNGDYRADGSGSGTWTCSTGGGPQSDRVIQRMRARILNDAAGWDDPKCAELGCGAQAESEPTDLTKIRGNYTHDDTTVGGGTAQTVEQARRGSYKMVLTVSMANDYNGYIATYRDYMSRDHYRKALTGWGPHSSDYLATRLVRLGRALKGDGASRQAIDRESDPLEAAPEWAPSVAKVVADQASQDAKVRAVGEAAAAGVQAYDATLPDDGEGTPADVRQPKDIERFDAATFTWVGGSNYTDLPEVTVQRQIDGRWVDFADGSGEVPFNVAYPSSDPSGLASYRLGGQVWKWTATFEAMVNRFALVSPQGYVYQATPAGTYRFSVRGERRSAGEEVPYAIDSEPFAVRPWSGITVDAAKLDGERRVTFSAGPSRQVTERRIRGTSSRDYGPLPFTIGPVDFPDFASDQRATGFRFLDQERGYSASRTDPADAEHYCLDCRFRDWLDATADLTAIVTFRDAEGRVVGKAEDLEADAGGRFRSTRALLQSQTAEIVIRDAWGDYSSSPGIVSG